MHGFLWTLVRVLDGCVLLRRLPSSARNLGVEVADHTQASLHPPWSRTRRGSGIQLSCARRE